ncbi:MAG: lysophospholipid acyltransferase family protein [Acidobacteriota bacterium]
MTGPDGGSGGGSPLSPKIPAGSSAAPPADPPRRRRGRSAARDRVEHAAFAAVASLLARLPAGSASRLGAGLARAYIAAASSRRRILRGNIAAAFPDMLPGDAASLARESVARFGAAFIEFLESPRWARPELESRVSVAGDEHLRAARERGRGVFLLSAHFGSWELGAVRAGMLGEPIASVVRPLDNALLEAELARRRTRFGNRLIRKKEAAREILRDLRRGGTVAILIDQNVLPGEGVFVPFFGRLAATSPSLALLQLKTDAAVVPVFTWPLGGGKYRLEFEKPIVASEFDPSRPRDERVRLATARYMQVTEAAVRKDPAAWLWLHNRWRTRPTERAEP